MSAAPTLFRQTADVLTDVRDQVKGLLNEVCGNLPSFPLSVDDIVMGRSLKLPNLDDVAEIMIPVRNLYAKLGKITRHYSPKQSELIDLGRFLNDMGSFVRKRHGFDNPDIFQITPETVSAAFLNNLKAYTTVQPITGDPDLQIRTTHPLRATFGLRDRFNSDLPLAFVFAAYTDGLAGKIADVVAATDKARHPDTMICYSIKSCESVSGAAKILAYGLIDNVHQNAERTGIKQVATLSPVRGFRDVIKNNRFKLPTNDKALDTLLTHYLLSEKDEAAKFHVDGNGARFERINRKGDPENHDGYYYTANYLYLPVEKCKQNVAARRPDISPEIRQLIYAPIR